MSFSGVEFLFWGSVLSTWMEMAEDGVCGLGYDLLQSHHRDLYFNPRGLKFGVELMGFMASS